MHSSLSRFWEAAQSEDEWLNTALADIRTRQDNAQSTTRQAADERIDALQRHLSSASCYVRCCRMSEQASEMPAGLKIMFPLYTFRRCERDRGITAERVTGERCRSPARSKASRWQLRSVKTEP